MEFFNMEDFIKKHLKKRWNQKLAPMDKAEWKTLDKDTHVGGYDYAKGSRFKVFETQNFGWIVFDSDTKTPNGHIPGKRILRW